MQKTEGKYPALFGSMKENWEGEFNKCSTLRLRKTSNQITVATNSGMRYNIFP